MVGYENLFVEFPLALVGSGRRFLQKLFLGHFQVEVFKKSLTLVHPGALTIVINYLCVPTRRRVLIGLTLGVELIPRV